MIVQMFVKFANFIDLLAKLDEKIKVKVYKNHRSISVSHIQNSSRS